MNWREQYEIEHALALSQAENVRNATRLVDETRSTIAETQGLIADLRATIAEQTHRADAADAEAAVWRERCESRDELLRRMEWQGETFDVGRKFHVCLACGGYREVGGHSATCGIAALLGSDAAVTDG